MSGTYSWPQVVNGKSFDFTTGPYDYVTKLPDLMGNFAAQLASSQTAVIITEATSAAASAQTAAQQAQAAIGGVTTGSTENLVYPAVVKNLLTASDVVDVFVYDTRLDSDGGAWTDRCSWTSWFNEPLNVANVRGAKRAFPKVAIIVLRSGISSNPLFAIYDALDLDPSTGAPRFWGGYGASVIGAASVAVPSSVFAINGKIYMALSGSSGTFRMLDFAANGGFTGINGLNPSKYASLAFSGNVVVRSSGLPVLASRDCNHSHARVLPGAPLDPVSGLPVPTVAVATASGVSVIHPDGRVCNITGSAYTKVFFADDNRLVAIAATGATVAESHPIPYASVANTASRFASYSGSGVRDLYLIAGNLVSVTDLALGAQTGLNFLVENRSFPSQGMVSYAAINYATGWQPGDIRLAAMCDGAVGAIAGTELVSNGSFTSDLNDWLGTTAVWSSGSAVITADGGATSNRFWQSISCVTGESYVVDVVMASGGNDRIIYVNSGLNNTSPSSTVASSGSTTSTIVRVAFVATSSTMTIVARTADTTAGQTFTIESVSVKAASIDRSYRGNALSVVGTLSRTAVDTGNDITAWSGFTASNYLFQPYTSNLDFGTGDFFISLWVNTSATSGQDAYLERANYTGSYSTGARFLAVVTTSGLLQFSVSTGASTTITTVTGAQDIRGAGWTKVDFVRRNGVIEIWTNGILDGSAANTTDLSNTLATLTVGVRQNGTFSCDTSSLTLLRFSASAPTPDQIRKMYADELALFIPGAKAFLGGTSNSISSLSHDRVSRRLAVATGDGVSVYSGLRRVEYLDAANTPLAIANDTMRSVSLSGGTAAFGTSANAGVRREAITALDRMPASPVQASTLRRMRATGVTTDATPLSLAPRIHIGERETVIVEARIIGRVYGAADTERLSYVRRGVYYRDAGGNVTLQGSVQTIGTDTETTSGADATLVIDTTAQTATPQVTGIAATRITWSSDLRVTRISDGTKYEEVA